MEQDSNFSFDEASTESRTLVLKPGVHEVKTESVVKGNVGDSEFIEIKVVDKTDSVLIQRFFLNTKVSPGKTKSAWSISSSSLLQIIKAANNFETDDEAKSKIAGFKNAEELATKLSYLIVGKSFRLKVNGKETEYQGKRFIKSLFGSFTFAESLKIPAEATKLKSFTQFLPQIAGSTSIEPSNAGGLEW